MFATDSEGTASWAFMEEVEMRRPRRQKTGKKYDGLGALRHLDLRIFVPLNGAGIL